MQAPLIIADQSTPITASIIWLHGLGADGYDFAPIVAELNLKHIRFILPHAPSMPVTMNNGYVMPAWYDLYGTTGNEEEDETGIRQSQAYINTLIDNEIKNGMPSERIAIAGFSQGGAIALQTALRHPKNLAAVLALSTYLPLKSTLTAESSAANQQTPIYLAHGEFDDIIPMQSCTNTLAILQEQAFNVTFHQYPMAHSVTPAEIDDIRRFLNTYLAPN